MATVQNRNEVKYAEVVVMDTIVCCSCGIPFGVPSDWKLRRRDTGNSFYCPNGHMQSYGETTADQLQKRLTSAEASAREHAERALRTQLRLNATRGVVTKQKQKLARVKDGHCPCCDKTFVDLRRHMAKQHPEFAQEAPNA